MRYAKESGKNAPRYAETGSALFISLVVMMMIAGLASAFVMQNMGTTNLTVSNTESKEAQLIADAAVEKARRMLWYYKANDMWDWNGILAYNEEVYDETADINADFQSKYDLGYYSWYFNSTDAQSDTADSIVFGSNTPYGRSGAYYVKVTDNDDGDGNLLADTDNHVFITATATLRDGTQKQVKALVEWQPTDFIPTAAITADGNFKVNGNPAILGAYGSVHANGTLSLIGNANIAQNATAGGSLIITGSPTVGGIASGDQAEITVPDIDPTDFKQYADYTLGSTGKVYDSAGALVVTLAVNGTWNNLKYTGVENWANANGTSPPAKTYYVEGNFTVKHTGSGIGAQKFTIIAEKSIEISSKASWQPYLQNSISMVAGGDLKVTGNPGSTFEGVYMTREQLKLAGTPAVSGTFIVKNKWDHESLVTTGSDIEDAGDMSGNSTLTYNGNANTLLTAAGVSCRIKSYDVLK